ncbi:alpha/beta fold hydrolase [Streptomyces sp. DH37]|uniref:alpha/beta fold hydrolase n=1 Tax=Streptomyces sp. DH37 TaxID=3040122 RepID=UPI0024433516|nr:alpha/beta hydrolase [Streptomyces sp. DH37]MDG9703012.1 alpha/beta hydrolase [Streptomyces sp. DH37]
MTTTGRARRAVRETTVPVRGGGLAVSEWPGAGEPVVALHGITANGRSFAALAAALADAPGEGTPLLAPDLRGRAGSAGLPGPYGLAAHAEDVIALLDHLGRERTVLVGHSMGAFVAALTAARHPDRIAGVVLVDGGVGFPAPEGADPRGIDALLEAVIGPAMRRLSMTFPDREAYRAFFRGHPALGPHWNEDVQAYVDRDLVGEEPELRSSCVPEAVRADGADVLADPETLAAARTAASAGVPVTLLWAERGMLDEPRGLYDEDRLAAAGLGAGVTVRRVPGVNHYSILFAPGATAAIRAALETVRAA